MNPDHFESFAKKYISMTPSHWSEPHFYKTLWQQMAQHHLFGLAIPKNNGGQGGDWSDISKAGQHIVLGSNIGIALSWIIQELITTCCLFEFGSENQKKQYIQKIINGQVCVSFAVSEPKIGSHPKYLTTHAIQTNNGFILQGEKSFVTNGPLSDLFIVIAVTEKIDHRQYFSAFLIPRDTPGLIVTPIHFNYLIPCQHASIQLHNVSIPSDHCLGELGNAYEKMVIPFRDIENALLMGLVVGGLKRQLNDFIQVLTKQKNSITNDILKEVGFFHAVIESSNILAVDAAKRVSKKISCTPLSIMLKHMATEYQDRIKNCYSDLQLPTSSLFQTLCNDLKSLLFIAQTVLDIQQEKIGRDLCS